MLVNPAINQVYEYFATAESSISVEIRDASESASTNEISNPVEIATLSQVDRASPSPSQRSLEEYIFDPHDVSSSSSMLMAENASQDSTSDMEAAQTELPSHSGSQDHDQNERNTEAALNEVFDIDFGNYTSATDAVLEAAETNDIAPTFYSDLDGNDSAPALSDLELEPATYVTGNLIEEPIAQVEDIDAMDMDNAPAVRLLEDDDSGSWVTETECSEVIGSLEDSSQLFIATAVTMQRVRSMSITVSPRSSTPPVAGSSFFRPEDLIHEVSGTNAVEIQEQESNPGAEFPDFTGRHKIDTEKLKKKVVGLQLMLKKSNKQRRSLKARLEKEISRKTVARWGYGKLQRKFAEVDKECGDL